MEFKEGNMVEVWRSKDLMFGSWWSAKIISKYGHTYCVRYEKLVNSDGDEIVDAVNYEELRPLCTHTVGNGENLMVDDVVEICDPLCCRVGEIVHILSRDWYLVRFGNYDKGRKIHKMNLRIPQAWDGNKWVSVVKGDIIKTSDQRVTRTGETCPWRLNFGARKCHVYEEGIGDNFSSVSVNCSKISKRTAYSLPESCPDDSYVGGLHKRKKNNSTEKSVACARTFSRMFPPLPDKVLVFAVI